MLREQLALSLKGDVLMGTALSRAKRCTADASFCSFSLFFITLIDPLDLNLQVIVAATRAGHVTRLAVGI